MRLSSSSHQVMCHQPGQVEKRAAARSRPQTIQMYEVTVSTAEARRQRPRFMFRLRLPRMLGPKLPTSLCILCQAPCSSSFISAWSVRSAPIPSSPYPSLVQCTLHGVFDAVHHASHGCPQSLRALYTWPSSESWGSGVAGQTFRGGTGPRG